MLEAAVWSVAPRLRAVPHWASARRFVPRTWRTARGGAPRPEGASPGGKRQRLAALARVPAPSLERRHVGNRPWCLFSWG